MFFLLTGVVSLTWGIIEYLAWKNTGVPRHAKLLVLAPMSPLLIYSGLLYLHRAMTRGLRLEVTPKGLRFQTFDAEKWADWHTLGPFTPINRKSGIVAQVIGGAASDNVIERREFILPAWIFGMSKDMFAVQLNEVRDRVLAADSGRPATTLGDASQPVSAHAAA